MKKKVFVCFHSEESLKPLRFLKEFCLPLGVDFEIEHVDFTDEEMNPEDFARKVQGASAVRMNLEFSSLLIANTPALPAQVRFLEVADVFFMSNGRWWPSVLVVDAVKALIIKRARSLEIRDVAYVVGAGPLAVCMASILLGLGYSRIKMVSEDGKQTLQDITKLSRHFLKAEISYVDAAVLTAEDTPASCLIIAQDLHENGNLLTDISYFNFMKRGGLVIDLNLSQGSSVILEEAARAELKVLSAAEIYNLMNLEFLKGLSLDSFCDPVLLEQSWTSYMKESKNQTRV